ncbi:hypothetical protein EST38_g14456, partial [Candolleomyces aberdarensis]
KLEEHLIALQLRDRFLFKNCIEFVRPVAVRFLDYEGLRDLGIRVGRHGPVSGGGGGGGGGGGPPGVGPGVGGGRRRRRDPWVCRRNGIFPHHAPIPEDNDEPEVNVEELERGEGGSVENGATCPADKGRTVAEKPNITDDGKALFDTICRSAEDSLRPDGYSRWSSNIHDLFQSVMLNTPASVVEPEPTEDQDLSPGSDYCLSQLARRCYDTAVTETHFLLMGIVQAIEFAAHVQRRMARDNLPKFKVLEHIITAESSKRSLQPPTLPPDESQPPIRGRPLYLQGKAALNRFYSLGLRSCFLAGAVARIRSPLMKISATIVIEIGKVIAHPDDSDYGKRVREVIIPAVTALMKMYPISGKIAFFSQALTLLGGGHDAFNATDLVATEKIFYSLGFDTWVKERNLVAWAPCAIPIDTSRLWSQEKVKLLHERALSSQVTLIELLQTMMSAEVDSLALPPGLTDRWDKTVDTPDTIVISTSFNPKHPNNIKVPYGKSKAAREKFTDNHRGWAQKAKVPVSVQDIGAKLIDQLKKGYRSKQSQYTLIDTTLFAGKNLKILDVEGGLIALILASMPEDLRKTVFEELHRLFPKMIQYVKSKDQKGFYTIHFSWYNRYATGGEGVPVDANPLEHPNVTTTRVTVPRESRESLEWEEYKMRLMEALAPLFQWISSTLQTLIPDTFEVLQQSVDILPLGDSPLVYPFTGFVINFNVSTLVHRDFKDKEICLVFQISDCTGGELGMVEPGMAVRLRNCDGILFRSHKITHFNNDYEGKRLSLVLHTDRAMDKWEKGDYNGWGRNVNFRASRHVDADPNKDSHHSGSQVVDANVNDIFST